MVTYFIALVLHMNTPTANNKTLNMKTNKIILLSIVIITLCAFQAARNITLSDFGIGSGLLVQGDDITPLIASNYSNSNAAISTEKESYYIPNNGVPANLNSLGSSWPTPKVINIDVTADPKTGVSQSDVEKSIGIINQFLQNMNTGMQVSLRNYKTLDLSQAKTFGYLSNDNVAANVGFSGDEEITGVYLFDNSGFMAEANAVAIPFHEGSIILGDENLMNEPVLFIHELGHTLGLTHHLGLVSDCTNPDNTGNMTNVMHEDNIGCVRGLTARQILLMQTGEYVSPFKEDVYYPRGHSCNCNASILRNYVLEYLVNFDHFIDNTGIVGNDEALRKAFKQRLSNAQWEALKANYAIEYDGLYNTNLKKSKEVLISKEDYVANRVKTTKNLMENNLTRWIAENLEAQDKNSLGDKVRTLIGKEGANKSLPEEVMNYLNGDDEKPPKPREPRGKKDRIKDRNKKK